MLRLRTIGVSFNKNQSLFALKRLKSTESQTPTTATATAGVGDAVEDGKLPARKPLVKNFFLGAVDKEMLGFPEVITREDLSKLQNELLPLKNFFAEEINVKDIDATRSISANVFEQMQELGLYGLNVPQNIGGKGYGWSQSMMAAEPESNCTDLALTLLAHRYIIDGIKEVGTEEQQKIYLERMAKGTLVGSEAIYEYNAPEEDYFNTTAEYDTESNKYILNGAKSFVITGPHATSASLLYLVIAQTTLPNVKGNDKNSSSIFLVESTNKGVKLGDQHITPGCRGLQIRNVKFDNVNLTDSNLLGVFNEGNSVAEVLMRSSRLRNAMLALGLSKNVLNEMAKYSVNTRQCGASLSELEQTKVSMSQALCSTYAMESMIYLTAGMMDEFSQQDVTLEAAITKYFALEHLMEIVAIPFNLIGPKSMHAEQWTDMAYRNALQLYTHGETMDTLRNYIALSGLQFAGTLMQDVVSMQRNPLFHPNHIFSKFLQDSTIEKPRTNMKLIENLHPSLEPAAQCLEHSVARLHMCAEILLTRYGNGIIERHNELRRLATMTSTIYAMFASASRASRAYCIGLPLADHELLIASAICNQGRVLVKNLSTEIFDGEYLNNDINMRRLSTQISKSKGYFPTHALTFNY